MAARTRHVAAAVQAFGWVKLRILARHDFRRTSPRTFTHAPASPVLIHCPKPPRLRPVCTTSYVYNCCDVRLLTANRAARIRLVGVVPQLSRVANFTLFQNYPGIERRAELRCSRPNGRDTPRLHSPGVLVHRDLTQARSNKDVSTLLCKWHGMHLSASVTHRLRVGEHLDDLGRQVRQHRRDQESRLHHQVLRVVAPCTRHRVRAVLCWIHIPLTDLEHEGNINVNINVIQNAARVKAGRGSAGRAGRSWSMSKSLKYPPWPVSL
eukprot:SAG31_NODE_2652_length_5296_cov_7.770637_4_plen_266_part_00